MASKMRFTLSVAVVALAVLPVTTAFLGASPVAIRGFSAAESPSISLRQARTSALSLNMQESRGICPICGTDVLSNQARETDDNGVYYHSACVENKLAAEGQTRISEAELAELKAAAAGLPPPPPTKRARPPAAKPAGNPFGFLGGLFGGGGGAAPSGPEIVDAPPPASAVPSQFTPSAPAPPQNFQQQAPPQYAPPPPQYAPPPPQAPPPQTSTVKRVVPDGQRVVPQAGMGFPAYWQENVDYFFNSQNTFTQGEIIGILRSDGNIKFGYIIGVNAKLDVNGNPTGQPTTYDVQVEKNGAYYQGKYADSLYKLAVDVMTEGIVLKQDSERGWF